MKPQTATKLFAFPLAFLVCLSFASATIFYKDDFNRADTTNANLTTNGTGNLVFYSLLGGTANLTGGSLVVNDPSGAAEQLTYFNFSGTPNTNKTLYLRAIANFSGDFNPLHYTNTILATPQQLCAAGISAGWRQGGFCTVETTPGSFTASAVACTYGVTHNITTAYKFVGENLTLIVDGSSTGETDTNCPYTPGVLPPTNANVHSGGSETSVAQYDSLCVWDSDTGDETFDCFAPPPPPSQDYFYDTMEVGATPQTNNWTIALGTQGLTIVYSTTYALNGTRSLKATRGSGDDAFYVPITDYYNRTFEFYFYDANLSVYDNNNLPGLYDETIVTTNDVAYSINTDPDNYTVTAVPYTGSVDFDTPRSVGWHKFQFYVSPELDNIVYVDEAVVFNSTGNLSAFGIPYFGAYVGSNGDLYLDEVQVYAGSPVFSPPPAANYSLTVDTVPSGASVFINGSNVGTAPVTVVLNASDYNISVTLAGYYAFSEIYTLSANTTRNYTLTPINYTWVIDTVPQGAAITVNGTSVGSTPLSLARPAGNYALLAVLAGYNNHSSIVTITGNTTTNVTLTVFAPPPPPDENADIARALLMVIALVAVYTLALFWASSTAKREIHDKILIYGGIGVGVLILVIIIGTL